MLFESQRGYPQHVLDRENGEQTPVPWILMLACERSAGPLLVGSGDELDHSALVFHNVGEVAFLYHDLRVVL